MKFEKFFIALIFSITFCISNFSFAQQLDKDLEGKEEAIVKDSSTEINVKNADIETLIRIFSRKTKRNYILDERVKGTVTIYLPGKISSEEAIHILDAVLALKGFTAVPIGDNLWKIIPAQEARQTTVPIVGESDGRGTPSVVTRFINLKYVAAEDVKELISSLVSSYGLISAYTGTNSLILIDSEDNINRLMKIIEYLDLPASDREMTIIPIEHADAPDIAEKINEILNEGDSSSEGGSKVSSNIPAAAKASLNTRSAANKNLKSKTTTLNTQAASVTVAMRSREPKIIADERTNSLIVVADEEFTNRIKALVDQLDSPVDLSGNRFYVYHCQHATAEELADVLSGLVGGGGSSSSSSNSSGSSLFGGSNNNRNTGSRDRGNRFSRTQDRVSGQSRTPGRARSENRSGSSGPTTVSFGEDVSITADPATNSLVIAASRSDYEKIKELLTKLDVKRRQVVVEAVLLEVAVNDRYDLSADFTSSAGGSDGGILGTNQFGGITSLLQDPTGIQDLAIAVASAGSLTLPSAGSTITIPTQTFLLRAANNNSNVNVLSAPTILATDNEQAEIVVGENVPFIASSATSSADLNNTFNQIDRQDVGITLRITPQISSSDFVTLQIFTEVSSVIDGTRDSELGPTTTLRTSETTVITKDSQMIVIGGLMSDNVTQTERGVPFLKDLPLLGSLFESTSEREEKRNLLIFITPRIIQDQFDIRDFSYDKKDDMHGIIESYKLYPDRKSQVLDSEKFDNVTDGLMYEGKKPGTIRPSDSLMKKKENSVEEAPLSLRLQPEKDSTSKVRDEKTVAKKQAAFTEEDLALGRYVVMEIRNNVPKKDLPGFISQGSKIASIHLSPESSQNAKNFFRAGNIYSFATDDQAIQMQVVGIFFSDAEARGLFPEIKSWYTLPAHEILNLGKGPWLGVR